MNQETQPLHTNDTSSSENAGHSAASATPSAAATAPPTLPTASLYVGELSPEVNESMLFELFSQYGQVASIRVCRDAVTRRSLGYAYVNFHSTLDGERAMDELNYTTIKGHPCRIMWSQRDPSLRRSGLGNVFIKDLEKSIDNKALHDTFSAFGNILSCKVVTDENGASRGYGFVHFETQEAADLAIEKVNGMLLNDKKVFVGPHISRRERVSKKEEAKARFTNIYVKNLEPSVDDEELKMLFQPFGEITSAVVQRNAATGVSKCFGFVNFATHESAISSIIEINGRAVRGREITVCRAQPKAERAEELRRQFEAYRQERLAKYQGVNLYVKNLDESVEDDMLRDEFAAQGSIVSCKIMRDEKGISKGFGFVCFSSPEETTKALAEMNGRLICGKPIYVAMAQRKEDRRLALESQFSQRLGYLRGMGIPGGAAMLPGLFYHHPHPAMAAMAGGAPRLPHPAPYPHPMSTIPPTPQMMYSAASRRLPPRHSFSGAGGSPPPELLGSDGSTTPPPPFSQQPSHFRRTFQGRNKPSMPLKRTPKNFSRGPGPRGGPKYNQSPMMMMGGPSNDPHSHSVLMQALASASPETQKSMIGDLLYPAVESVESENAAKITGMLLDSYKYDDLLHLLASPDDLSSRITQASELLQNAGRN